MLFGANPDALKTDCGSIHCLREWATRKLTCPLCVQQFSVVMHSFSSSGEYLELCFESPQPAALSLGLPTHTV